MDDSEQVVEEFLRSLDQGEVAYEPDGNVPPDFVIGGRTAVEVRRLNQNYESDGDYAGLEEVDFPLLGKLRSVLASFGPPPADQRHWYVLYRYTRPLPPLKTIENFLQRFVAEIRRDPPTEPIERELLAGFEVKVFPRQLTDGDQFRIGIVSDEDSGGMLLDLMERNIRLCVREKREKIKPYRSRYPSWWLVLVDFIGWGLDDFEQELFRSRVEIDHDWDRVVLLPPHDHARFMDI